MTTETVGEAGGTRPHPDGDTGRVLLGLAERAIRSELRPPGPPNEAPNEASDAQSAEASDEELAQESAQSPWLAAQGAAFVTLHVPGPDGRPALRGCIGTIEPYRSLREDVQGNARAAAFRDPRFAPLSAAELPGLQIEVSVLSPPESIPYVDRADLAAKLRPGIDGLVLEYGGCRGTYLPQVWEQIPDASDFLSSLVMKTRLPQGFWSDEILVWRYTVTAFVTPEAGSNIEGGPS